MFAIRSGRLCLTEFEWIEDALTKPKHSPTSLPERVVHCRSVVEWRVGTGGYPKGVLQNGSHFSKIIIDEAEREVANSECFIPSPNCRNAYALVDGRRYNMLPR